MSNPQELFPDTVDLNLELGAYEALWSLPKSSVRTMADLFRENPYSLPSELIDKSKAYSAAEEVKSIFAKSGIEKYGVRLNTTLNYPIRLRDAKNPVELLYYRGNWDLINTKCIAIVGSRKVSNEGISRTKKLVKMLVDEGYTIVSGLANGVDRVAHETAIFFGGKTIAVIGTPIHHSYPKENRDLQEKIATEHLLVSSVPVLKYEMQDWRSNRGFFPERNKVMSALTKATVIIEAGETSGTLIQARAAFYQGRLLFILESNFHKNGITWPKRFEEKGAIRVDVFEKIKEGLLTQNSVQSSYFY